MACAQVGGRTCAGVLQTVSLISEFVLVRFLYSCIQATCAELCCNVCAASGDGQNPCLQPSQILTLSQKVRHQVPGYLSFFKLLNCLIQDMCVYQVGNLCSKSWCLVLVVRSTSKFMVEATSCKKIRDLNWLPLCQSSSKTMPC